MFRRVLGAVFTLMLLGYSTPVMGAAAPPPVTRASFCVQVASVLGLQPVSPATPDFKDVSANSPDYSVIEAAYQAGWVSGVQPGLFDPNGSLTRAQAAKIEVLALGNGNAAKALAMQSTAFRDDRTIPAWSRGYINEAVKLGLISGYPDDMFRPDNTLTAQDATALMRKLAAVWAASAYSVTVRASSDPVAVGQRVNLTATVTPRSGGALWGALSTFSSTDPNVVISGSTLIASAPGTYQVIATYSNSGYTYTGNAELTVSGPATSMRIVAPAMVVANGSTQTQIEVDLLDAAGNVAVGDNGTKVGLDVSGGAFLSPSASLTATTASGVATFTLTDGSVPGAIGDLVATDTANGVSAKADVTAESQVPAQIVLTAPAQVAVNKPDTTAAVQIALRDSSGQAVLSGMFPLTVSLQGPATFADGAQGMETVLYTGNGQGGTGAAYATATIQDVQGQTGQIVVSVGAPGVPTATVTIAAVIGGRPNQIEVTTPSGTITRDETAAGITFGLSATDANGLLASTTTQVPLLIAVEESDGSVAQNFTVDSQPQGTNGYLDASALQNGSFTIKDTAPTEDIGTYIVQVTDPAGDLVSPSPTTFTVTAGVAAGIRATLGSTGLWVQAPKTTLTVQVVDAFGNPVSLQGIMVQATSDPGNSYPVTISPTSAVTDSAGQATFAVQAASDLANKEAIDVSVSLTGKTITAFPEPVFMVQPWGP